MKRFIFFRQIAKKYFNFFFLQNAKIVSLFLTKSEEQFIFLDKMQKTIRYFLIVYSFSFVFVSNMNANINQAS